LNHQNGPKGPLKLFNKPPLPFPSCPARETQSHPAGPILGISGAPRLLGRPPVPRGEPDLDWPCEPLCQFREINAAVSVSGWGGNEGRAVPSDITKIVSLFTPINPLGHLIDDYFHVVVAAPNKIKRLR
jgi:hypothetical protein